MSAAGQTALTMFQEQCLHYRPRSWRGVARRGHEQMHLNDGKEDCSWQLGLCAVSLRNLSGPWADLYLLWTSCEQWVKFCRTLRGTWPDRDRTLIEQWSDLVRIVGGPWADRDRTLTGLWSDFLGIVSVPWADSEFAIITLSANRERTLIGLWSDFVWIVSVPWADFDRTSCE